MFARFAFLFALCLGLAVVPVRALGSCAPASAAASCQRCCATPDTACCELSGGSPAPSAPSKIAPAFGDAKQLAAPALIFFGLAPLAPLEPPAVQRQQLARMPAPPLLEKTCIRLV